MALSLSNFLLPLLMLLQHGLVANAATVTFDWNITWVTTNPDGMADRPTIGINGQWPLPALNLTKGDRVIVNAYNGLGNQSTSLHFHGMFQNGTNEMDGPVGVNQCGIPPGSTMVYNFTVSRPMNASQLTLLIWLPSLTNLALTGTTPTREANTQMAFVVLLSSTIQRTHTQASLTRRSPSACRIGTMIRCRG